MFHDTRDFVFKLQFDPLVGGRPSIMVSIESSCPLFHFYHHHLCGQGRPSMAPYKAAMGGAEDVEEETNSGDLIAMNR